MRTFTIDDKHTEAINAFKKKCKEEDSQGAGAIGGRFQYVFIPTGLGVITKVKDSFSDNELDLTDYDMW